MRKKTTQRWSLCSLVFLKGKLPDVSNDTVWCMTLHDCCKISSTLICHALQWWLPQKDIFQWNWHYYHWTCLLESGAGHTCVVWYWYEDCSVVHPCSLYAFGCCLFTGQLHLISQRSNNTLSNKQVNSSKPSYSCVGLPDWDFLFLFSTFAPAVDCDCTLYLSMTASFHICSSSLFASPIVWIYVAWHTDSIFK